MFMLVSLNDSAGKLLADPRGARLRAARKLADLGHGSAQFAADPTLLEKLREAELANQATLAGIALQQRQAELAAQTAADAQRTAQYQAEAADRASARDLAALQPKDWMRPTLSVAIVGATIAVVFLVLLGFANGSLCDPIIAATAGGLVMYLLKELSQVTGFWFGMTSEASITNAKVADFATSPGTVTVSAQ